MDIGIRIIQIGGCMFIVGSIMAPFVWFVTTRYFDNLIGLKNVFNPIADAWFPKWVFRTDQYVTLVVFRRGMKKSYDRRVFGDFDFRAHARTIDKVLSFVSFVFGYGGLALILIGGAVHSIFYLISLA